MFFLAKIIAPLILFFILFEIYAKEKSRPKSKVGDNLVEITPSLVFEPSENIFEIGIDYERFLDSDNHHYSIGIASEIEFKKPHNRYYLGPMISGYFHHFKAFASTGVLLNAKGHAEWKSRVGLGYEKFLSHDIILVPTVGLDMVEGQGHFTVGVGLAYEY